MRALTGNVRESTIPPTPPLEDLQIAQLPPYWCITEPCYDNPILRQAASGYSAPGWLKSWISGGSTQGWRSKIQSQTPGISSFVPAVLPLPSSSSRSSSTPPLGNGEANVLNPNRPVVEVTTAQRDQFYRDRASILARYPGYVAGAESDPIFVITDAPVAPSVVLGRSPPEIFSTPPIASTQSVRDPVTTTGAAESNRRSSGPGAQPMGWLTDFGQRVYGSIDFNPATPGIFGSSADAPLTSIPDLLGGLASTYLTSAVSSPAAAQLPPYINPSTQVSATNIVPITAGSRPTVGCISQRDIQIAAAAGTSPEMVDLILKLGRRNRRRRRMLTKSDIGDISTMRQILGNGEAFKLWLAKATR